MLHIAIQPALAGDRPFAWLNALRHPIALWRRRRRYLTLLDLDDHLLDDIGVQRSEVEEAAALALHENAAVALRDMALERRRMKL